MTLGRVARIWKERVIFCQKYLPSFRELDASDDNRGEFSYEMFTVLTQHIYANSITELIDMGLAIEKHAERLGTVVKVVDSDFRYTVQDQARYGRK